MVWTVTVEDVLKRWIGDAPESNDEVLQTLTSDAIVLVDLKVKNIDGRLYPEPPKEAEGNLQTLLNMIVSTMVQRAYNSDYSTYSQESYSTGPFSQSFSKSENSKQGLYLTSEELELLNDKTELKKTGIQVIKNPARPNFNVRGSYGWGEFNDCW